jgi:hypothetical protein
MNGSDLDICDRPANFVISYSERVGSTALIDTLKQIPNFLVPVFEDLDFWWIEKQGLLNRHTQDNIHELVAYIYDTLPDGMDATRVSVGFKWRMWGDQAHIAQVLRDRGVIIFNLVRCDMLECISSLYLSNVANRDFNAPQFLLRDAPNEAARLEILFKYRMQKYEVDLRRFFDLFEEQLRVETKRTDFLCGLQRQGCTVYTILSEDFGYKRFRFLNSMLRLLRHPPLQEWPSIALEKVSNSYPSESFTNRAALVGSERLIEGMRAWDAMVMRPEFRLLAI